MTTLLRLDQVTGRYGAVTALQSLTLDIGAGTRHAVIGPNGAGKSTLLHLIAGSLPTAGGRILFDGRNLTHRRPDARARAGIARTFQHPGVMTALTVRDNMRLALRPSTRRRPHHTVIEDALEQVGLAPQIDSRAGQLPYGQQRLLELGMALATRPRLLLLDEPSAGLGPADIDDITAILTGLRDETTVVLVDHHLPLVWAVAETVTVLHLGQHLATGTPADIQADPHVRRAYLNPPAPPATTTTRPDHQPGTARPILLEVLGLRAGYHGADVLNGLDINLHRGTVHAVLGRNGAGKTTLLNTIAGLHPARDGKIRIDGVDLLDHANRRTTRPRVAIVPQGRRLFSSLSTAEHLRLAARTQRSDQPWTRT